MLLHKGGGVNGGVPSNNSQNMQVERMGRFGGSRVEVYALRMDNSTLPFGTLVEVTTTNGNILSH